jgi:hypothetical protein
LNSFLLIVIAPPPPLIMVATGYSYLGAIGKYDPIDKIPSRECEYTAIASYSSATQPWFRLSTCNEPVCFSPNLYRALKDFLTFS